MSAMKAVLADLHDLVAKLEAEGHALADHFRVILDKLRGDTAQVEQQAVAAAEQVAHDAETAAAPVIAEAEKDAAKVAAQAETAAIADVTKTA